MGCRTAQRTSEELAQKVGGAEKLFSRRAMKY
jgi:hypothetical protein